MVDRPGIEPGTEACKATVFPSIPTAQILLLTVSAAFFGTAHDYFTAQLRINHHAFERIASGSVFKRQQGHHGFVTLAEFKSFCWSHDCFL